MTRLMVQKLTDSFGTFASVACLLHCIFHSAVHALMLTSGVEAGLKWGILGAAFLMGSFSAVHGFRIHGRMHITLLMAAGLGLLICSVAGDLMGNHAVEHILSLVAVPIIAVCHIWNFRECKQCTEDCCAVPAQAPKSILSPNGMK